jgi:hypothetical protein
MSDDSTIGEPDAAQPQEPAEPGGLPAVDPVVPEVAPDTAPAEPPAFDAAAAGLAPLAAGTSAGWYHTTVGHDLRYWDGVAWTAQTAPGEAPKASFGTKYKRRFGVVLLVVAGVNALSSLVRIGKPSILPALSSQTSTILTVVVAGATVVGLVAAAALWTLVAAAFPGRPADPAAPRKPFFRRALPWGIVVAVLAAPLVTYSFVRTTPVDVATIASPKDGCHAYLDTIESMAQENGSAARVTQTIQALHDAALTNDPALAADLEPVIANPTSGTSATATKAILTRCVDNGDLTTTEIQDWAKRVQAIVAKLKAG